MLINIPLWPYLDEWIEECMRLCRYSIAFTRCRLKCVFSFKRTDNWLRCLRDAGFILLRIEIVTVRITFHVISWRYLDLPTSRPLLCRHYVLQRETKSRETSRETSIAARGEVVSARLVSLSGIIWFEKMIGIRHITVRSFQYVLDIS